MFSEFTSSQSWNENIFKTFRLPENYSVVADSRLASANSIFIAYRGEYGDGRDYIQSAIDKGVKNVIAESDDNFSFIYPPDINHIEIPDLRMHAGEVASFLLHHPSHKMLTIGITGTNGKTSISQWLAQALDLLNFPCAIIGTAGNGFFGKLKTSSHTTPDAVTLQNLLADFHQQNAKAVSMEVSSHGLEQFRVQGTKFDTAVFTNLTRDHLDYHGDMEHYGAAKKRLFFQYPLRHAVINIDDDFGRQLTQELEQQRPEITVLTYGFSPDADIHIKNFQAALNGNLCDFVTPWGETSVHSHLLGRFNAQNTAACIGVLGVNNFALEKISAVLEQIQPAKGRMDCIFSENKPLTVIDYAHTPDALEKALSTLKEIKTPTSKLWCVFGCGGNRDRGKRPLMGKAAHNYADKIIITSDNPRMENPQDIINDILPAVPCPELVEPDRAAAIAYAVRHAQPQDIILIAGKGHENYQDIQGVKHHFDDFEQARKFLQER